MTFSPSPRGTKTEENGDIKTRKGNARRRKAKKGFFVAVKERPKGCTIIEVYGRGSQPFLFWLRHTVEMVVQGDRLLSSTTELRPDEAVDYCIYGGSARYRCTYFQAVKKCLLATEPVQHCFAA